jgi:hypothetical protein
MYGSIEVVACESKGYATLLTLNSGTDGLDSAEADCRRSSVEAAKKRRRKQELFLAAFTCIYHVRL